MTRSGDQQASAAERRYAYVINIRPGTEEQYAQAHADMPVDLKSLYRSVGFRTYSLFLTDSQVFAYCETSSNPVEAFRAVADHPLECGFEHSLSDAIVHIPTNDGIPVRLREVWSL